MKYKFTFKLDAPLELPINYNHVMQASLIAWLNNEEYQKFLHDCGYEYENRTFKMYSYSKIFGTFRIDKENKKIIFFDSIYFYISSYDRSFVEYLGRNIITENKLNLVGNLLSLEKFECIVEKVEEECMVKTLSPITVYSTLMGQNGKKKTYYYSPFECEFSELIKNNLIKKFEAFNCKKLESYDFEITPIKETLKESIILYKGFIVKGWNGVFKLKGNKELIEVALNAGLGSKNSQGMGCIILKN